MPKTCCNAFRKTALEAISRAQEVNPVIVTGFLAEGCVLSTVRQARDLDLTVIILRNRIDSGSEGRRKFVEKIRDVFSDRALKKMLEQF
ncbi:MAG TPA: isochorismatase family protein [Anaerolineaceae bacterium]|nr:isochorismatase family protein [Anaerolineaceae bacterium]